MEIQSLIFDRLSSVGPAAPKIVNDGYCIGFVKRSRALTIFVVMGNVEVWLLESGKSSLFEFELADPECMSRLAACLLPFGLKLDLD